MTSVLLVGADGRERASAAREFEAADYTVIAASGALEGLRKVYEDRPDAVVLDLDMPEMSGEEFTRIVRALADIPILALGPTGDPQLIVRVLDCGADDYLEQPVNKIELVGRLRAALRRVARQRGAARPGAVVRTGDLEMDFEHQVVRKRGKPVSLTPTEYRLMSALASRVGRVAPHRYLLSTVWGDEYIDDTHYLRIYVGYLRKKIEDDPSNPKYLLSQWGTGYRLAELALSEPPRLVRDERRDEDGAGSDRDNAGMVRAG